MDNIDDRFKNDFGSIEKLNEYLALNSFENNLDLENLKYKTYSISHISDSNYLFDYNGNQYQASQLVGYENDNCCFYTFSFYRYSFTSKNNLFASVESKEVVVLPFFEDIIFCEKFNIIICSRSPDSIDVNNLHAKKLYYFDVHGRFIKEEIGNLTHLPNIAMIDNKIIPISYHKGFYIEKIHAYFLFEISKYLDDYEVFNLIDNNGILYSQDFYHHIIVSKTNDKAILQKENVTFYLDIKTRLITRLVYNALGEHNDNFVKVITKTENSEKYGIIDYSGLEVVKPIFDYVDFFLEKDRFKVFNGNYDWVSNKEFENEFKPIAESIGTRYNLNKPYLEGKLVNGKWGIINSNLEHIIPAEYNWIEDYNKELYLANIGGDVYKYASYDLEAAENSDKEITINDQIAVLGGKWVAINKISLKTEEVNIQTFYGGKLLNDKPLKLEKY